MAQFKSLYEADLAERAALHGAPRTPEQVLMVEWINELIEHSSLVTRNFWRAAAARPIPTP